MKNRKFFLCGCAIALSNAVIPSAASAEVATTDPTCQRPNINSTTMRHLRMNRLFPDAPLVQSAPLQDNASAMVNRGRILGYTRITVDYRSCGGDLRDYNDERRNALKRYFMAKKSEKVLQLTATHRNVKVVAPFTSISRESGKKGEDWTTGVENGRILLPYFRADEGSTVKLEVNLKSTREYNTSIASGSIEILQKASALISPTALLITKENEKRFNEAADFLDGAIDGLLKVSIDETSREDFQLNKIKGRELLAIVTLFLPMANNAYASPAFPDQPVGQWVVYAEPYILSVFGEVTSEGRLIKKSTSPGAVLDYEIDDNKTLREQLAGTSNVTSARDALVGGESDAADAARKLCRAVTAEGIRMHLTPTDADAAAWAYLVDLALPSSQSGAESGCAELEKYPV